MVHLLKEICAPCKSGLHTSCDGLPRASEIRSFNGPKIGGGTSCPCNDSGCLENRRKAHQQKSEAGNRPRNPNWDPPAPGPRFRMRGH